MRFLALCLVLAGLWQLRIAAGEAIPPVEMQALDRAITRELNTGSLGSQTLGELTRLRSRLAGLNAAPLPAPGDSQQDELQAGVDPQVQVLRKLEAEAAQGGRAARRALAFYYISINEPEKARQQWQLMGKGSEFDISYAIMSAYLEIALGEHNSGKASLASALSMVEARSPLKVTNPVFCQNIAGYRIYEPRRGGPFLPGEDVLIYVEIEGAQFVDSKEGGSECVVMFGLKLRDDEQNTVWVEPNFGEYAPLFNGPIRDLHAALTWKVPNNLDPGRYHLFVEAVEESTMRRGEGVSAFEVGKRPTNPEKSAIGLGDLQPLPPKGFQEMQDVFPGAPAMPGIPSAGGKDDQKFQLLQRYYQQQRQE